MSFAAASVLLPHESGGTPRGFDEDAEPIRCFLEDRDPALFAQLVRKYELPVFRLTAAVLGPGFETAAEDLTQEIFVVIFHKLGSFRFGSRFSTWLYRIAFRKAIDEKRRARYVRPHVGEAALENLRATEPDALEQTLIDERHRELRETVASLREPHRTAVLLFYWLDQSVEEIATLLCVKPATVRSYLFRGRTKVREQLEERP